MHTKISLGLGHNPRMDRTVLARVRFQGRKAGYGTHTFPVCAIIVVKNGYGRQDASVQYVGLWMSHSASLGHLVGSYTLGREGVRSVVFLTSGGPRTCENACSIKEDLQGHMDAVRDTTPIWHIYFIWTRTPLMRVVICEAHTMIKIVRKWYRIPCGAALIPNIIARHIP